jgi:hypothetical protein
MVPRTLVVAAEMATVREAPEPDTVIGAVPLIVVIAVPADPLAAAVNRPLASTVMVASV